MKILFILWIILSVYIRCVRQTYLENCSYPVNSDHRLSWNTKQMAARRVIKKVLSVEQAEGAGARVRRSVGRPEVSYGAGLGGCRCMTLHVPRMYISWCVCMYK